MVNYFEFSHSLSFYRRSPWATQQCPLLHHYFSPPFLPNTWYYFIVLLFFYVGVYIYLYVFYDYVFVLGVLRVRKEWPCIKMSTPIFFCDKHRAIEKCLEFSRKGGNCIVCPFRQRILIIIIIARNHPDKQRLSSYFCNARTREMYQKCNNLW